MPETNIPTIERSKPQGETHPLAQTPVLRDVTETMRPKQEMVRLVDYLRGIATKPRGTKGQKEDLNSHFEEFIIKDSDGIRVASLAEFQTLLSEQGLSTELLGVQSIGNPNQRIEAVVQGVDRANPTSGFERPVLIEGPHMILAPYAFDKKGQLHLFRTIQYRTGEAVIDTPRGFADSKALASGQKMYDIEGSSDRVKSNMTRIVGEESGDALQIKRILYLGAHRVNGSFVPADQEIGEGRSAIFGVEVDYDAFKKSQKLVTVNELRRRQEQKEHEGLTGDILDFTLAEYANYKKDSDINKDAIADFGSDTIALINVIEERERVKQVRQERLRLIKETKESSPENRELYLKWTLAQAKQKGKHPNEEKAQAYLKKITGRLTSNEQPVQSTPTEGKQTNPTKPAGLFDRARRFLSGKKSLTY